MGPAFERDCKRLMSEGIQWLVGGIITLLIVLIGINIVVNSDSWSYYEEKYQAYSYFLLMILAAIAMMKKGYRQCMAIHFYRSVYPALYDDQVSFSQLAEKSNTSLRNVPIYIRWLKAKKFLYNEVIIDQENQLLINRRFSEPVRSITTSSYDRSPPVSKPDIQATPRPVPKPEPKLEPKPQPAAAKVVMVSIACSQCGGQTKIERGGFGSCRYCDSPIQDMRQWSK